mmetsp:Transcript_131455/g.227664  ORF Transcript_131455/g.227664 Transcript_131455/m.227664 type:complete len:218 (-) Transcript_131455:1069-1722(-)
MVRGGDSQAEGDLPREEGEHAWVTARVGHHQPAVPGAGRVHLLRGVPEARGQPRDRGPELRLRERQVAVPLRGARREGRPGRRRQREPGPEAGAGWEGTGHGEGGEEGEDLRRARDERGGPQQEGGPCPQERDPPAVHADTVAQTGAGRGGPRRAGGGAGRGAGCQPPRAGGDARQAAPREGPPCRGGAPCASEADEQRAEHARGCGLARALEAART